MTTGSLLNMRESFVQGLLRKSVPQSKFCSTSIERAVLMYMRRVYIQCRKRNRNGGRDDLLLNCHIGCKKPTADRDLIALRGFLALLQDKFMSKWWH